MSVRIGALLSVTCAFFTGCARSPHAWSPWTTSGTEARFGLTDTAALPLVLQTELKRYDEFESGTGDLPGELRVCVKDFNADGTHDFVIQSPRSYSGGPMMYLFARRGEGYVAIGDLQGMLRFEPPLDSHLVLDSMTRGGGGVYTRCLRHYQNGRYEIVRIADYHWHYDDPTPFTFVRERDPKPYRTPANEPFTTGRGATARSAFGQ